VKYFLERCEPFEEGNLVIRAREQLFDEDHEHFICVRPHPVLQGDFGKIKKILWSGDAFDQPSNDIFFDKKVAESMNAYVFKSNWQRKKILEKYYHIDRDKTKVIYNGYRNEFYTPNGVLPNPKRFIHASVWYRGLVNFVDIWPKILEKMPDAEIHVFSKAKLYSEYSNDEGYHKIIQDLVQLPGMVLREPVPQEMLVQEMKKAWLMLYPNTGFVESSCGAALQSIAAGTPVIATNRAGLPETIGKGGILIEQNDEKWKENFVKAVLETDKSKRKQMVDYGYQQVSDQTWKHKAEEWENFLKYL
jgi:glycosyltransferase involved in cell wall biosynthesis